MTRRLCTLPRTLACAAAAVLCPIAANALDLTVEVLSTRSTQGFVYGALYASPDAWLKSGQMLQGARTEVAGKTVLVFRDLTPGRHALAAFHDENGNGRLDVNAAGAPLERNGFSRDAVGMMSAPAFDDAVLDLQSDTVITVRLR